MAKSKSVQTVEENGTPDYGTVAATYRVMPTLVVEAVRQYYRKAGIELSGDDVQFVQDVDMDKPLLTAEAPWQPIKFRQRRTRKAGNTQS
jgi:hypothetical protein